MNVVAVKYLREVTPYFRKMSVLSEIGWAGCTDAPNDNQSSATFGVNTVAETKILPLHSCYICRNVAMSDARNATIELHAPDGRNVVLLRTSDERSAARWCSAIGAVTEAATRVAIRDANRMLADDVGTTPGSSREIKHFGWLAEQVCLFTLKYFCL